MRLIKSKKFRTDWRLYGARIFFTLMLLGVCLFLVGTLSNTPLLLPISCFISSIGSLLFLTVPCGTRIVNTNKTLWSFRQAAFLFIGLFNMLNGYMLL